MSIGVYKLIQYQNFQNRIKVNGENCQLDLEVEE